MSDSIQELLKLYKNEIIDGEALNNAIKTLNNAPQVPQPQEKALTDKVREKRPRKKKMRKPKKGGNCCGSKKCLK